MDRARLGSGGGAFWRCQNCGDRFVGPSPPENRSRVAAAPSRHPHERHRHRHGGSSHRGFSWEKWIVPIVVLLTGVAILMFLLDNRAPPRRPRVMAPR